MFPQRDTKKPGLEIQMNLKIQPWDLSEIMITTATVGILHRSMNRKIASGNETTHHNYRIYSFEQIARPDIKIYSNV